MTLSLTKEQEALVEQLMQGGYFPDGEAVIEEALHLLEQKLKALKTDLQAGLDHLDQGFYNEYTSETLPQHLEALKQRNQARLARKP